MFSGYYNNPEKTRQCFTMAGAGPEMLLISISTAMYCFLTVWNTWASSGQGQNMLPNISKEGYVSAHNKRCHGDWRPERDYVTAIVNMDFLW
jgi:hypothetical protein